MHPERWQRIESLYHQAVGVAEAERAAFLDRECGSDLALRQQIESLLAQETEADTFLEEPALAVGARLIAGEVTMLTGRQLGPYQVVELLGAGGMGEVYRAHDTRLGRDVAIKILRGASADDSRRVRRFLDEARAAGALNHPNILAVYDVATDADPPHIVVELVDGESLRAELKRGALRLPRLLDLATQIADGLTAAHGAQIVHRDLKPDNIMVTRAGRVRIVDFGLAKSLGVPRQGSSTSLTAPHAVIGTAAYMSPEQARGEAVDFRSDIFSFGAVLYEMATGQRAFERRSSVDTLSAILRDEPRPAGELNEDVPPELQRILARCLAKAPDDRYAATADLLHDLRWLKEHPAAIGPAVIDRAQPGRRIAMMAALGLALATAGFLIGAALFRAAGEFPTWRRLTFEEGVVHAARFAPGGETILYSASWDNKPFQVFSTTTLRPESRPLDLPPSGLLAISPTGQLALSLSCVFQAATGGCAGTLARAPLLGGAPRELAEKALAADWGPNDTLAAVIDGRLEYPVGTRLATDVVNVRISPDGQRLAYGEPDAEGRLAIVVRHGDERRVLSSGWTFVSGLAWATDGSAVFVTGYGPDNNDDAVSRVALDGSARSVLRFASRIRVLDAAAPDRLLVDFSSTSRRTWRHAANGSPRDLTWLGSSSIDALSNDGRAMLVTVRIGPTLEGGRSIGQLYPIYVRPTDGGPATFLGDGVGRALSDDGHWALTVTREGRESSLVLYPLGPGTPKTLDRAGLDLSDGAQSASFAGPDQIVFDARGGEGAMETYVQSTAGGPPARVEHEPGQVVSPVAPDGERFISRRNGGSLWLATLTPSAAARLPFTLQSNQFIRQWSADGREIFIITTHHDRTAITRIDIKTGASLPHGEIVPNRPAARLGPSLRVSRDGHTIVYTDNRTLSALFLIEGVR
jgi:hypothetical protein